ncbi:MAG: hypothetical protein EON59_02595 [Alphaproteobacteria bacterium]|nr:MAG: hypothetical protein EON59_02595 [Alphaproteobacteria bacterium]
MLLTVDGRKVTSSDPVARAAVLEGPAGSIATLTLKRQTGETYTVRVARDPGIAAAAYAGSGMTFEARRWIQFAFYALASLAASAAAPLLFIRRPLDPVAQLLSFSLVLNEFVIADWVAAVPDPVLTAKISITLLAWVCAVLLFPDRRFNTRWHWAALAAYIVTLLYGIATYYWLGTFTSVVIGLQTVAMAFMAIAMFTQFRRTPPGTERQQVKFVIFGIVAMAVLQSIGAALLVAERPVQSEGVRAWITLAKHLAFALSELAVPAGLLVSLLRYRLYDADAVISRSAAYAFLTLMLGAAFAASQKIIEVMGEEIFGESSRALSGGLAAAVAATLVAPLHNRVHRWTEQRFQRGLAQLRARLPLTVGDMREFASLDELLSTVGGEVEKALRATRVAVLIGGTSEPLSPAFARHVAAGEVEAWQAAWQPGEAETLECDRADTMFPARLRLRAAGAGTVGWLLLGPRPDGSFYGKDEREALAEIADPVARAVHVVRQRASLNARVFGRIHSLENEMARLVNVLASLGRPSKA